MALRFDQYRMRDAVTRLSERVLNPIFQDLDRRLDVLERLRADWVTATQELQTFGLARLDESIAPLLAQLVEQAEQVGELLSDAGEVVTLAQWRWVAPADSATAAYDGAGRLGTLTEAVGSATRVTVYAYDGEGRLLTETVTVADETERTTYSYNAEGQLSGWTRVRL